MNKNMELWMDEHGLDLIGYTLVACGCVIVIKGLLFPESNDGGVLRWILNL